MSITTFLVFVQHFREPNLIIGSLFAAFARTLWAFAICFIILATSMHDSKGNYYKVYHVIDDDDGCCFCYFTQ